MPQHKTVAKLESLALHQFCQIGARTCTALEEGGNFDIENNGTGDSVTISSDFESFLKRLPSSILERLISSTLKIIAGKVRKKRSHKGLVAAVHCMPQTSVHKLDYGSLFTEVRLFGSVNSQLKESITHGFKRVPYLNELKLSSKCTDEMLIELAKHCRDLEVLDIPLSDVSDRGLLALAGISLSGEVSKKLGHGCPKLRVLNIQDCMEVNPVGVASILRNLKEIQYLYYDKLVQALEIVLKLDMDYIEGSKHLKICHIDQYGEFYNMENNGDEMAKTLANICPHVESFRFYISRNGCASLQYFQTIKHLQIETSDVGTEFRLLASKSLSHLVTLHLTFRSMSQVELLAIADICHNIEVLRLIGNKILDDEEPAEQSEQPKHGYFVKLKSFEVRIVKNFGDVDMIDIAEDEDDDSQDEVNQTDTIVLMHFFFTHAFHLQELIVSGPLFFPSEQFFEDFLKVNPLSHLQKLCLSPHQKCPILNVKTAMDVIFALPSLNTMALTRWSMTSQEIKEIGDELRKQNLDVTII